MLIDVLGVEDTDVSRRYIVIGDADSLSDELDLMDAILASAALLDFIADCSFVMHFAEFIDLVYASLDLSLVATIIFDDLLLLVSLECVLSST